jgi:putative transposase
MKANHLQVVPKRLYLITTDSHHRFRKYKNLIDGLVIERQEQVSVSDITYIGNRKILMYLPLITDAYPKKIMGFNASNNLSASGAITAMKQAT